MDPTNRKQLALVTISGMLGIVVLESIALLKGINGTLFGLSIAALTGITAGYGGFTAGKFFNKGVH